jgi:hypothetical protein
MPDQIQEAVKAAEPSKSPEEKNQGWFKRMLPAVCCGAPLLLVAAISLFGLSLGAVASGLLSLAAVLACPLGMYFMMRMMVKR